MQFLTEKANIQDLSGSELLKQKSLVKSFGVSLNWRLRYVLILTIMYIAFLLVDQASCIILLCFWTTIVLLCTAYLSAYCVSCDRRKQEPVIKSVEVFSERSWNFVFNTLYDWTIESVKGNKNCPIATIDISGPNLCLLQVSWTYLQAKQC